MNNPNRAVLCDSELDALFTGSAERLLAAYLRSAVHTIAPGAIAYWAELLGELLEAQAPYFADDQLGSQEYAALTEALRIDAARLRGAR